MPRFDQACRACSWTGEILVPPHTHPPCPVCGGATERVWRASARVVGDDIPGGLTLENVGHEPVTVYSHAERRRLLKERGLEECVRHVPVPGTDKSPHTTSWASVSPETLATAGAWLAARSGGAGRTPSEDPPTVGPIATPALVAALYDTLR